MKKIFTLVNTLLLAIFFLGFVVRVWGIDKYPTGFTQDEAALGYDAYSLLKTGKDQWGEAWPLTLRSFGDFKLPLYSYLAIPSIAIFGLNEYATRLPSAVIGILAVVATYLFVIEMTKNKKLATISSVFLALSPWHISLSRGAFEANLTVFFMTSAVWCFLKGLKDKRWMFLSSVLFGLNLFSYHSARLITPIIYILTILFFYCKTLKVKPIFQYVSKYKLAVFTFLLFLIVAIGTIFIGGGKRGVDILIINPTDKWQAVSDRRYQAVLQGLPDVYSRVFSNKLTHTLKLFYTNYLTYLSPNFLFTQGVGDWGNGMIPGRGVLYSFELLTVGASIYFLIHKKSFKGAKFIMLWILISPLPAALSKGSGSAIRSAVMMPAIQIFSAYGAICLYNYLSKFIRSRHFNFIYYSIFITFIGTSVLFFFEDYVYHEPVHAAQAMQVANSEIVKKVLKIENNYSRIRISRTLSVPQIWVAFYSKWDPADYQNESKNWLKYQDLGYLYIDQMDNYSLGKYSFGDLHISDYYNQPGLLVVGKPEEFPKNALSIDEAENMDGTPAYIIVESENLN